MAWMRRISVRSRTSVSGILTRNFGFSILRSQLPGLVRVDSPGLRSVVEHRQANGLVHLQFGVQVNTVAISHGGLQPVGGLTGFGDKLSNLVIDSRVV
ncbi:unnamed protein product [Schistocephalus solidus]|uniref:Plug domain-containing protein n=1 Tax=Schistocephalus solidus TaxID=70667 RepID=A0A183SG47_SCHSO|nr:unnamed protein product [Schistocephalus solidus]